MRGKSVVGILLLGALLATLVGCGATGSGGTAEISVAPSGSVHPVWLVTRRTPIDADGTEHQGMTITYDEHGNVKTAQVSYHRTTSYVDGKVEEEIIETHTYDWDNGGNRATVKVESLADGIPEEGDQYAGYSDYVVNLTLDTDGLVERMATRQDGDISLGYRNDGTLESYSDIWGDLFGFDEEGVPATMNAESEYHAEFSPSYTESRDKILGGVRTGVDPSADGGHDAYTFEIRFEYDEHGNVAEARRASGNSEGSSVAYSYVLIEEPSPFAVALSKVQAIDIAGFGADSLRNLLTPEWQ